MSHLSKVFTDVPIEIQDRSGFDLSHSNLFTTTVGTLTPCLCEEVLPGDIFNIGVWFQTKTPPLATPFYGRVDAKVEVFACANSVLWAGWKQFIQYNMNVGSSMVNYGDKPGTGTRYIPTNVPELQIARNEIIGKLPDYLGCRNVQGTGLLVVNALPFIMYHKIVDDYYRNALITKPMFNEAYGTPSNVNASPNLCNVLWNSNSNVFTTGDTGNNGYRLADLRQRCWAKDAFTTATFSPQFSVQGAYVNVQEIGGSGEESGSNAITIADLRAANALQKFLERSNCSTKYDDFVMAHYGVYPSDAIMDKPMFLGQVTVPVYVNSVANTSTNLQDKNFDNKNLYNGIIGGQGGNIVSVGDGSICNGFKCNWHGYIMGIYSLVPHANYASGIRKYLGSVAPGDFAFPEFAAIGDEAIMKSELNASAQGTFGYNRRYYRYLYHDDEVHGQFADGQTLSSFVLSRAFDSGVTLGSQFMEIPKTAMDEVLAYVDPSIYNQWAQIGFQAMVDMYWNIKVLRRLPESPLPHL